MVLCRCWHKLKIQKNYQTNKKMKGEREMRVIKRSKILALALSLAMLICAMPMMASADVSEQNPIEINTISFTDDGDLLDVEVTYSVYDAPGIGDQITILATVSEDAITSENANTIIAYIDQVAKPANPEDRKFSFKVEKEKFAESGTLFVKIGGSAINTPGADSEDIPTGGTTPQIPEDKITIKLNGAYGIAGGGTVTVDNAGNIVDPGAQSIKVGNVTLFYNAARNKFVGIVRTAVTAEDVTVVDGASEELVYGDVDGDGVINTLDAGDIINIYLGNISATDRQLLAADVDDDGNVNTLDAGDIINKYLNNISNFIIEGK